MKQSGFGTASLILGIVGLVFSCFIVGIIPALLGLIFAIVALCQKNTKHGMAIAGLICSIIGIVFSAIIILLGIAGSGSTSQTVLVNKKQEEISNSSDSSSRTESTMISPGYSFDANGITVTINNFDLDFTDYDDSYGLYAPEAGKKYICIEVTFTNNAKTDRYVSSMDFQCYADDSVCDEKYGLDSDSFIGASLSSGRKTSGRIYYEVPENAQSIELEYETDFWTDHKEIMKLQ